METEAKIALGSNIPGSGNVMKRLLANKGDIGALRPYEFEGNTYIDVRNAAVEGGIETRQIHNADSTLLYDEWKWIDTDVRDISRKELRVVNDLRAAGLSMTIPNGLGFKVMQYQKVSDISDATIGISPVARTDRERPVFGTDFLSLPYIFKDWSFDYEDLQMSRNGVMPLDRTMVRLATRKIAEAVEKLFLGVWGSFSFGGGPVYGLTNFPNRVTGSMSDPTASGWTGDHFVRDLLDMRAALKAVNHKGPFRVYVGPGWDQYLDEDRSAAKMSDTVRERASRIPGVSDVVTADYLPDFDVVMVELNEATIRVVDRLGITPVLWEQEGGLVINGKLMCSIIPNIRADYLDQCGIAHYTVS